MYLRSGELLISCFYLLVTFINSLFATAKKLSLCLAYVNILSNAFGLFHFPCLPLRFSLSQRCASSLRDMYLLMQNFFFLFHIYSFQFWMSLTVDSRFFLFCSLNMQKLVVCVLFILFLFMNISSFQWSSFSKFFIIINNARLILWNSLSLSFHVWWWCNVCPQRMEQKC